MSLEDTGAEPTAPETPDAGAPLPEVVEAGEVVETSPDIAAVEGRARRMGWRPKEEFRGDPEKHVDAATFVERGETELPVLRERYRKLDDRAARTEAELRETKGTVKEVNARLAEMKEAFNEYREFSRKSEERAYQRARTELESRMAAAVESADTRAYNTAKAELDVLENARPDPAVTKAPAAPAQPDAPVVPQIDPVVTQWVNDNASWFHNDAALRSYATEFHGALLRDRPGLSMSDNLAEVKREVMARFPEKFPQNARRAAPAAVAASAAPANRVKKPKGLADLPPDAQASFQKFKKWMPDLTEKEYVDKYLSGDEK